MHFASGDELAEIHIADDWERMGTWVIDAERFQKRINDIEAAISYIFTPEHRERAIQRIHVGAVSQN